MNDGEEFDLVVLGSGAAGLCAALVGGAARARVLLVEKSPYVGGTTAMAGGCTWVPCNHHMAAAGLVDTAADALEYIRAVAPPGWAAEEETLWQAFVEHAPAMLSFVERESPLRFGLGGEPDPYPQAPGARLRGRNVSPRPLRFGDLGSWRGRIRPSPMPFRLTYDEITDHHLAAIPARAFTRFGHRLAWRVLTDRRAMGQAFVAGLLLGCLRHRVDVRVNARAQELIIEAGRVGGVVLESDAGRQAVRARLGVVIATGGFEWDPVRMARHHPGPVVWTASPSTNTGDGHRLAEQAGACFERMDQALIMGTRPVVYLGEPHAMPAADYTLPHSMIVNRSGRRFVNELQMNIGLALDARDPATGERVNMPAWRIYDAQYAARYRHMLPAGPERLQAGSLRELAAAIGVDADGLEREAARMTDFARAGRDDDFGRGGNPWDPARSGDPRVGPNSCLGSIEQSPFHAYPIVPGFLGTKGGPRTDERARVLDAGRRPIAGLFCAGNAMANPFGSKAVGAGTTLGPCLAWGYIAAHGALAPSR